MVLSPTLGQFTLDRKADLGRAYIVYGPPVHWARLENFIMKWLIAFALLALPFPPLSAQKTRGPITNADVISMTKAGLAEQTIVLAISQGPSDFDTSPQTLIQLKKAEVSDRVLNAMLAAPRGGLSTAPTSQSVPVHIDPSQLLSKALDAIAPKEKLTSIKAIRMVAHRTLIRSGASAGDISEFERVASYPGRIYLSVRPSAGPSVTEVLTPEFNYFRNGNTTSAMDAVTLQALRTGLRFDPLYIARHPGDLTLFYDGSEGLGTEKRDKIRLRDTEGVEEVWSLDETGRIRRITRKAASGKVTVTDLADYRLVDGVYIAFILHSVAENGLTIDLVATQFQIDPVIDPGWFAGPPLAASTASPPAPPTADPSTLWGRTAVEVEASKATPEASSLPAAQPSGGLRIKVLQEQSVPYVVQSGGGISTTCSIAGAANTTATATALGNLTLANASTNSIATMTCNSNDTTIRWQHVLNAMLVEASDGNAYIIGCDRAWPWSKCVPLRPGDVFDVRNTNRGMAIRSLNAKGKESEATYAVLQSKSLR